MKFTRFSPFASFHLFLKSFSALSHPFLPFISFFSTLAYHSITVILIISGFMSSFVILYLFKSSDVIFPSSQVIQPQSYLSQSLIQNLYSLIIMFSILYHPISTRILFFLTLFLNLFNPFSR